jgi:very-short-patch-repair endonuclease
MLMTIVPYRDDLNNLARRLRKQMTDAELKLWARIRRKQICGVQFYRQKPLLDFIVDFYAPAARLVVEVDGGQHFEPEHQRRDARRDQRLEKRGICVRRYDNIQVLRSLDVVVDDIQHRVEQRLPVLKTSAR